MAMHVPLRAADDFQPAAMPYRALWEAAQLDASGLTGSTNRQVSFTVSSTNPEVKIGDIALFIDAKAGRLPIAIATNGIMSLPISAQLFEENPNVVANQPKGSMNINFAVEDSGHLPESDAKPSPAADAKTGGFFAGRGTMAIRGRWLPSERFAPGAHASKFPLYRFHVSAYGESWIDGKPALNESDACPIITIRSPQPLEPDVEYTFVGEDGGGSDAVFVVKEILSPKHQDNGIRFTFANPPIEPASGLPAETRDAGITPDDKSATGANIAFGIVRDPSEHGPLSGIVAGHIAAIEVTWASPDPFKTHEQAEGAIRGLLAAPEGSYANHSDCNTFTYIPWSQGLGQPDIVARVQHADGNPGALFMFCSGRPGEPFIVGSGAYWFAYKDHKGKWWFGSWGGRHDKRGERE